MSDEGSIAPLGAYAPRDRCYLCGTQYGDLELVVAPEYRARAFRCVDVGGCERRRYRRRQLRLFGKASSRIPRRAA